MSENNQETLKDLINVLMHEMEKSDPSMKAHATRVANQCVLFLKDMGRPFNEINQLYIAALLHDIGMIYIPKEISAKKNNLTETEMAYIKKHTLISEKILSKYVILKDILPIIRSHHEAFDGSGYPEGLRGNEIPTGAKILCIINNYDTLLTNSISNDPVSHEYVLNEIQKMSGTIFDKIFVDRFIKFIRSGEDNQLTVTVNNVQGTSAAERASAPPPVSVKEIITEIIQKFKKHDLNLPVLPEVVKDIQGVINSPSSGIDQLAAVIEKDAVISVRLISVANSVLYRGTEKILSVKHAITRLGAKETQSIVATIANKGLYEVKDMIFKKLMEKLWKHSLASAFAARSLSEFERLGEGEKFYFMGLVHDIGKVLILKTLGDLHHKYESLDVDEMLDETRAVHASFGSAILRKWGLGDEYARICLLHAGPKFRPATDREILIMNLAGNIAKKAGYGVRSAPDDIDLTTLDSKLLLGIEPPDIDPIIKNIEKLMTDVSDIFN